MKKLLSSLAAKAVAMILLVVMLLVATASVVGTVVLVGDNGYLDNGKSLRQSLLSTVVYQAARDLEPLMDMLGQNDTQWIGYDTIVSYYEQEYDAAASNLCIRITDEDGKTLFQNREYADFIPETEYVLVWNVKTGETYTRYTRTFASAEEMYQTFDYSPDPIFSYNYDEDPATGKVTATYTVCKTTEAVVWLRVAVLQTMQADDACLRAVAFADKLIGLRDFLVPVAILALCIALAMFIFLLCAAGHKAGVEGIHLNWVDKIPFDLYLAALVLAFVGSVELVAGWGPHHTWQQIATGVLIAVWLFLGLSPVLSFASRAKAGKWWRNTVIFYVLRFLWRTLRKIGRGIAYLCRHLPLVWKTALVCLSVSVLELIALLLFAEGDVVVLWLIEKLLLVPLVLLAAVNLRALQKGGEALAEGDMDYRVSTRAMLPDFRRHAENLNSISLGMQKAVEVQMRSERMKAELITNVSHDIKTPLTSIVNYVDLLKTAGLNSEHAPEYLEVLDRQSARLKKLTEDLVEASKASTGNIAVHAERTNVNVLIAQAAGEYEERLREHALEPVLEFKLPEAYIWADGRLLWRVLDNLLNNICKYSLEHTRVYIQTEACGGLLSVTFKNISRDALNVPAEELMERFVRGDASRSAEGSGLGLSIARSLTELQGGQFALHIDGDLFKAELTFPLLPTES